MDAELKQQLAAILAADVSGYSRLMSADAQATVAALDRSRSVFRRHIEALRGRVVDMAGDAVLATFDSASAAVRAAMAVQQELAETFRDVPEPKRMRFRIGLHMGEVLGKDDGTVYGDGVNIAARLESLAEVGGITASAAVAAAVRGHVDMHFVDQGEQVVKNIPYPVHAFRWVTAEHATPFGAVPNSAKPTRHPSLAVMPFANLSNDPEQEYFADGIAEDLITVLSRLRWLSVIARNSTFQYKGKSTDVRELGKALGARYMLEGSVRKSGERVRISCHLVDASDGNQVWAERYDRALSQTFDLQDEISVTIAGTLEPELSKAEQERVRRKPVDSLDVWELFQRGLWHFWRYNKEAHAEARRLFKAAADRDPQFAPATAYLALSHYSSFVNRLDETETSFDTARDLAMRALAVDGKEPLARFVLGRVYTMTGQVDAGVAELQEAVRLSPSFALAHYGLGAALLRLDRWEEACDCCATAERLSPHDPSLWAFQSTRATALSFGGQLEQAEGVAKAAVRHPAATFWACSSLVSILGHLGRPAEAKAALDQLLALRPDFSMGLFRRVYGLSSRPSDEAASRARSTTHFFEGLYKAGLPRTGQATAPD
ncbi:adenylate/guanylate cyclase domain-containing protein [Ideonella sp. A 288]|uniref:adenylate/guanylate cyclase domain-containing protein n=1 Tax=Ideonella sp. A 288 TaxID=1962181 RepID=UPI000B4ACAF3|nr:adenylate/guanylate cyclase domain-containing protein [Ideonella sp. A 288]